jgi:TDG/mug DNA glycosylase family protein
VPDVIGPGLRVLFTGINPGRHSGAARHHFAGPANRFWPVLHLAGFTDRRLAPAEEGCLLERGIGITNLVARTTAGAADLTSAELRAGAGRLAAKVRRYRPAVVAVLGLGAYRTAFRRSRAAVGPQPENLAESALWVLPNPSGLQAHYQLPQLVDLFSELRRAVDGAAPPGRR